MKIKEAAVALILCPRAKGGREALFIQRVKHPRDPWSGQISLPGGRRDPGDEDLFATAVRETREETGIRLGKKVLLGRLPDLYPRGKGLPRIVIRSFVFRLSRKPPVRPSAEADHAFWVPVRSLSRSDGMIAIEYKGDRIRVPAFITQGRVIWGITRRILLSFFEKGF